MALVTATESRTGVRDLYVPTHERGMVHRSYLSPDRKQVLLVEMENGGWLPCRVVPFNSRLYGKTGWASWGRLHEWRLVAGRGVGLSQLEHGWQVSFLEAACRGRPVGTDHIGTYRGGRDRDGS